MNIFIRITIFCSTYCFCYGLPADNSNDQSLIRGGQASSIEAHPSLASLRISFPAGPIGCTATVLNTYYLLTAGHCIKGALKVAITVGTADSGRGTKYDAIRFFAHEDYMGERSDYDVGLVKAITQMKLSNVVRQAQLAGAGTQLTTGETLTVVGFGDSSPDYGYHYHSLYAVEVLVVDFNTCKRDYNVGKNRLFISATTMFCAGAPTFKGFCTGDSGAPAINKAGVQVGIVSKSVGCGDPHYPGVYTSVASVRQWITDNVK